MVVSGGGREGVNVNEVDEVEDTVTRSTLCRFMSYQEQPQHDKEYNKPS